MTPPLLWISRLVVVALAFGAVAKAGSTRNLQGEMIRRYNNADATNSRRRSVAIESQNTTSSCSTRLAEDGMPPKDVHRSALAAKLSHLVYGMDGRGVDAAAASELESHGFSDAVHFEAGIDAVLTARYTNDYCLAAFRGTTKLQIRDWLSNLDAGPVAYARSAEAHSVSDGDVAGGCDLHKGYYEAYAEFEHRSGVEDALRDCLVACPTCQVVLTGHSQGGAIAEIGALFWPESNPLPHIITFGAPQPLGAGCLENFSVEARCSWYHYVLATRDGGMFGKGLVYDPVPTMYASTFAFFNDTERVRNQTYARNGGIAHPGHTIVVDAEEPGASYYLGFDGNFSIPTTDLKVDATGNSHRYELYDEVLEAQSRLYIGNETDDGTAFLPTDGFSVGLVCNTDQDMCGPELECAKDSVLDWETTCQPLPGTDNLVFANPNEFGEGAWERQRSSGGSSRARGVFFPMARTIWWMWISLTFVLGLAGALQA